MAKHFNSWEVTDEIVADLKQTSIKASFAAEAALEAYRSACEELWQQKITRKAKVSSYRWIGRKHPLVVTVRDGDKHVELQLVGVSVSTYGEFPIAVICHRRLKSGKWSKSDTTCNAEWIFEEMIS